VVINGAKIRRRFTQFVLQQCPEIYLERMKNTMKK
jgi:hypothetical protein